MTLIPKNWSKFQHYKKRDPIWIKLHRSLLNNYEFMRLPIASKALAPLLWLLASEYEGGRITDPLDAVAFRLRLSLDDLNSALKPLIDADFFSLDSKPLARRKRAARPEKERETEREADKKEPIQEVKTISKALGPVRVVEGGRK